jgi:hypothetical protein
LYSRQNRNPRADVSVELPRDYSGSAFSSFQNLVPESPDECHEPEHKEECAEEEKDQEMCERSVCEQKPPKASLLGGLSGILGGNIGLEELLLLGVIFLIFSDDSLRDNELLICLLLILFI